MTTSLPFPYTLNNLRVTETGTSTFLQLNAAAGAVWTTLRPIGTPDKQLIVCVGTPVLHRWYFLQDLLDGLASDDYTFSVDSPLPPPAKPDWGDLSEAAVSFAVRGALGFTVDAMRDTLGGAEEFAAAQAEVISADLIPHKASVVGPLWEATTKPQREALARTIMQQATKLYVEPSKTTPSDLGSIVYNAPRTLTPDQLENVTRRIAVRTSQRTKWPFANMSGGQSVFIEASLAAKGQRAAHAYGASAGVVFVTHRLNNGDLEVIRTSTTRPLRAKKGN
jgi:hypothetical protein